MKPKTTGYQFRNEKQSWQCSPPREGEDVAGDNVGNTFEDNFRPVLAFGLRSGNVEHG